MLYIVAILSLVLVINKMTDPYVHILAMPLKFLRSNHLYRNSQCLLWQCLLIHHFNSVCVTIIVI